MTTTSTYTVSGMTCGHCEASIRGALSALAGVNDVSVDLDTGQVTVTSDGDLDTEAVRRAADEAGYALAS
jgi:copper chaperone CopZ